MQARRFYLDTQQRSFVSGVDSTLPAAVPSFFQEDVESIELYFLRPNPAQNPPYLVEDYSANTVKLAVGLTAPAALQTSWTAVSTAITASITTLTNGGAGANEVQKLTLTGNPPSEGGYSLTMPSRAVTVSSVAAGVFTSANHGLLNGQSVTLTAFTITASSFSNSTYLVVNRTKDTFGISTTAGGTAINAQVTSGGGTATLPAITTPQIDRLANADGVSQAFVDAGIVISGQPQIIVTGSYEQGFTFTFANSQANINFDPMTVSSTLSGAKGLQANVSFNTTDINNLITAGNTTGLKFEVEVTDGTKRHTYQTTCNLGNDIIASTSPTPTPGSANFLLSSPDNSTWSVTIDNSGVLTATKQ
jgi:multisubunit Na+/H+ antiporter MnhC subunit